MKTILETKIYAGMVVGNAPTYDRFYGGGIGSLRGFKYRGISPRGENDDPIGGDWMVHGSAGGGDPLRQPDLFLAAVQPMGLFESGGVRSSIGTGIQIMIPQVFGPVPMRFELARRLPRTMTTIPAFSFSVRALFKKYQSDQNKERRDAMNSRNGWILLGVLAAAGALFIFQHGFAAGEDTIPLAQDRVVDVTKILETAKESTAGQGRRRSSQSAGRGFSRFARPEPCRPTSSVPGQQRLFFYDERV